MKIIPAQRLNAGDRHPVAPEEPLANVTFKVHKFNARPRPAAANVVVFPHFSEFGSELVGSMYCLPFLMNGRYQGKYSIVMGWHGRAYLYRHLVDEFWEIGPESQWLRDYCRCFHHASTNLKRLEKRASALGQVIDTPKEYGVMAVNQRLSACSIAGCGGPVTMENNGRQRCDKCNQQFPPPGFYHYIKEAKSRAVWVPPPSAERLAWADSVLPPNPVGVTARNRRCYGRNLPPEYYARLIERLEGMGYSPVWLGEAATTHPCPVKHVLDLRDRPEAADLESVLAVVSRLKFTVQYWTASTRLAGVMGVPYVLFESPDQVYGNGQEGYRLSLCTRGRRKVVLSHYRSVLEDQAGGLDLTERAIRELEAGDDSEIIGMVEDVETIRQMQQNNAKRVGGV